MYPFKDDVVQCPVCNAIIGRRDKRKVYNAHCDECKATFWWKQWAETPTAVLDSHKTFKGYCGPDGCKCRD